MCMGVNDVIGASIRRVSCEGVDVWVFYVGNILRIIITYKLWKYVHGKH